MHFQALRIFFSVDFVNSLIASIFFIKIFWKEFGLSPVSFPTGFWASLGVCGCSDDKLGVFWVSCRAEDRISCNIWVSDIIKDVKLGVFRHDQQVV